MKILKAYNNNIVLAEDKKRQVVAVGSGIGFSKKRGDDLDVNAIETIFNFSDVELERMNMEILKSFNVDEIVIVSNLVDELEQLSQKKFNSSMIVSLIDHIKNSSEFLPTVEEHPMRWVVKRTNPTEYEMAKWFIKEIENSKLKFQLSHYEITSIALHLINNQSVKNMYQTVDHLEEINTIISMIEYKTNKVMDKKSISYSRFTVHLRFLLNRLHGKVEVEEDNGRIYSAIYQNSSEIIKELCKILVNYLERKYDKQISDAEKSYLLIHLNKLFS